jgi:L-seryl-tRNA(Ser) seleniumtransferase
VVPVTPSGKPRARGPIAEPYNRGSRRTLDGGATEDPATTSASDTTGANGVSGTGTNPYRRLPSIERLLGDPRLTPLTAKHGREAITEVARAVIEEYRETLRRGGTLPATDPASAVVERAASLEASLRSVINATGVVLHTNLGRAPLSDAAIAAMRAVSRGYSNLEFDLDSGERGSRFTHLEGLLRRLTSAEAGIAVNNNASALLLALSALTRDREVVISRGQLVEIGGGFRIPDVMRQSGATLVEVGTTNRTYLRDYAEVVNEQTAALLRVHASNFRVVGFTEQPRLDELGALARERGLLLLDDVGSGALIDPRPYGLGGEPLVQESIAAGADVVLFSGDKLLGGPQAGIAAGKREAIEAMRRHPLARAVRLDKASIAALAATLEHYARGEAATAIPVWRMIAADPAAIRRRARRWARAAASNGVPAEVVRTRSMIGGGSLPEEGLDSWACALPAPGGAAQALAARLRHGTPAIVARIEDGRVLLDPRTVDPRDDAAAVSALRTAISS